MIFSHIKIEQFYILERSFLIVSFYNCIKNVYELETMKSKKKKE